MRRETTCVRIAILACGGGRSDAEGFCGGRAISPLPTSVSALEKDLFKTRYFNNNIFLVSTNRLLGSLRDTASNL